MRWLKLLLIMLTIVAFMTGFNRVDKTVQEMLDGDYKPAFEVKPFPPEPKVIIWGEERGLPSWAVLPEGLLKGWPLPTLNLKMAKP